MTTIELLLLVLYGLMTMGLGRLALRACGLARGGAAASYLTGQLVWLILFLLAMWGGLPVSPLVWLSGGAALAAGAVHHYRHGVREPEGMTGTAVCLGLVLALCFPSALIQTWRGPLVGWDARSIWFFHGKAIWVGDGIRATHFAAPVMALFHTDYPLLIPVQAAVLGFLNGAWSESAVKSFLILNLGAYLALLAGVLRHRGWPRFAAWGAAALAATVAHEAYVSGYADNHYALPLAIGAFVLFDGNQPWHGPAAATAVLLCMFALNIKNEADWYVVLVLAAGVAFRRTRPHSRMWRLCALGIVPFVLWAAFKVRYGIENDLGLSRHLAEPLPALRQIAGRLRMIRWALGILHHHMRTLPPGGALAPRRDRRLLGRPGGGEGGTPRIRP